ncbi:right-handed parallel beta-helix repeat-containing protein [Candidatus Micrarchaeota archaeon]|nr:right-handed parallel beta-helix repeat-containing protein [Candidatus Micrarchaeota archaeon]
MYNNTEDGFHALTLGNSTSELDQIYNNSVSSINYYELNLISSNNNTFTSDTISQDCNGSSAIHLSNSHENRFTSNTAHNDNNGGNTFDIYNSNNNTFTSNTVYSTTNAYDGFYLYNSSQNIFTLNTVYGEYSDSGIWIDDYSLYNSLTQNVFRNLLSAGYAGFQIYGNSHLINHTYFYDNTLYNNLLDFYWYGNQVNNSVEYALLGSGASAFRVSIEINDASDFYGVQSSAPAALPYGNKEGRFVNFTDDGADAVINLTIYIPAGYDWTSVKMYKYNGTWYEMSTLPGVTCSKTADYIRCNNISSFSTFGLLGSAPATTSSSSSTSKTTLDAEYEFDCETGELTISVKDGSEGVSGAVLRLIDQTSPFQPAVDKTTDSSGEAVFAITEDSSYKVIPFDLSAKYTMDSLEIGELTLCKEEVPEEEVLEETPAEEEQPEEIIPEEEIPEEETPEEVLPPEVTKEEAQSAVDEAQSAVNSALNEGKDTSSAEAKLQEAKEAFSAGNYELAEQLAEEAVQLALSAPLKAEEAIKEEEIKEEAVPAEEAPADYSWALWIVLIVVILAVGYYYFKKSGTKKGHRR